MSLESWRAKYYPVDAGTVVNQGTDKDLLKHALKKYEGTLPGPLEFHNVRLNGPSVVDRAGNTFSFNEETCTLCEKYIYRGKGSCNNCILSKSGNECNSSLFGAKDPYSIFKEKNDPAPMIKILRRLIRQCNEKGKWIKPRSKS